MNNILFGIALAAMLSLSSFLMVLLRVSPLTEPRQAVPAFIVSVLLSTVTAGALLSLTFWKHYPHHTWDTGKITSVAVREGVFLGCSALILLSFHLLRLLNWWIALMIVGIFVLVELALIIEK